MTAPDLSPEAVAKALAPLVHMPDGVSDPMLAIFDTISADLARERDMNEAANAIILQQRADLARERAAREAAEAKLAEAAKTAAQMADSGHSFVGADFHDAILAIIDTPKT